MDQRVAQRLHDVDAERLEQAPDHDEREHAERGVAEQLGGRHSGFVVLRDAHNLLGLIGPMVCQ